jgi:beta-mannosidase
VADKFYISQGWEFRLVSSYDFELNPDQKKLMEKWLPANVPGTVHTDLLTGKKIPDPFYSDNENELAWIDECDWEYRTSFTVDSAKFDELVFEGIDTIADIYLNDTFLLTASNMFVAYHLNVSGKLLNGTNRLRIVIKSAKRFSTELEQRHGKLPVELESHRVYLRKAQYSFGWDWGPAFPTAGLWKDVYLEKTPPFWFSNVKFVTEKIINNSAYLRLNYDLKGDLEFFKYVAVKIENGSYRYEENVENIEEENNVVRIQIENPELWFPNGYGAQNLYTLTVIAVNKADEIIDEYKRDVGIRTVELKLEVNGKSSFQFIINGKPVFIMGVNWIPADSFLPAVNNAKYETLLSLSKEANINMVRVWGGGIYEEEIFYDTCDKLGLLVWQDFMFACGAYPEHDEFINNVKSEINSQISRLRNHPSLAIWCGNNENEWIWFSKYSSSLSDMPGHKIFHKIIPEILEGEDPERPYWPSSPFGFDEDPNAFSSGNTHQWEIWSNWVDYTDVAEDKSLFVTEFGFQSPANIDTINSVIPAESRMIESEIFKFHNKQVDGPERLNFFLEKHLPVIKEWEDYIYLTQLNQAFALDSCLRNWKMNGITNGAIIWQLNDCWPVSSWSVIDSHLAPKLSYHFVKNIFEPCIINFFNDRGKINVHLQNMNENSFSGKVKIFIVESEKGIVDETYLEISVDGNSEQILSSISGIENKDKNILVGRVLDKDNNLLHTVCYKYYPWKNYKLFQPNIEIGKYNKDGEEQFRLTSDHPALFVDLYCPGVQFSSRGFIVMPDEEVYVSAVNKSLNDIEKNDIRIFSLNDYLK